MSHEVLKQLEAIEQSATNQPDIIRALEAKLEELTQSPLSQHIEFWLFRNQFRVKHAAYLQLVKPRILIGLINYTSEPNFQTLPLFPFADVVTLADSNTHKNRADRLLFDLEVDDISEVVKALPLGFTPDYFWDPQVCGLSMPPIGLEKLPFVTIAGICHTFRAVNMYYISSLYDVVAPVSTAFVELFRQQHPGKHIIDIPFGGNWASFHATTAYREVERDIDLLISFSKSDLYEYGGYRNQAIELAKRFAAKYQQQYRIEIVSGVGKDEYHQLLFRSKIGLNVVGFNGPYNYRSCELMNHGVALMQMEVEFPVKGQHMDQYFVDGQEYISFNQDNFEQQLTDYLSQPEKVAAVAAAGKKKLETHYTYFAIHQQLYQYAKQLNMSEVYQQRRNTAEQTLNWLRALNTSPEHHKYKVRLFAKYACSSQNYADADDIRRLIMGLSVLHPFYGERLLEIIYEPELKSALQHSLFAGLTLLFTKLENHQLTLVDKWHFACLQALYDSPQTEVLQGLKQALEQLETDDLQSPSMHDWLPLTFNVDKDDYATAKTRILDYQFLLASGNKQAEDQAMVNWMSWWCDYFLAKQE